MPTLLKKCVTCGIEKDQLDFDFNGYTKKDGSKARRLDCKLCCRKRRSEYFKDTEKRKRINERRRTDYKNDGGQRKSINRRYALKANYGITVEDVERMLNEQHHSCKICGLFEGDAPKCRLYVDHDHKTGKVRGLLCQNCNNSLGHAKENIETLLAMIQYLSEE